MSSFPKCLHACRLIRPIADREYAGAALAADMINLPPQIRQPEYTGALEAP